MYLCFFCKKSSLPGEKLKFVVTQTKPRIYPPGRDGKERLGVETVREEAQCPRCYEGRPEGKNIFELVALVAPFVIGENAA